MNTLIALALLVVLAALIGACGDMPTSPSHPKKQPVPTTERSEP